jgi:hypothetical protein
MRPGVSFERDTMGLYQDKFRRAFPAAPRRVHLG